LKSQRRPSPLTRLRRELPRKRGSGILRFFSPACGGGGRRSDREGAASSPPLAGEMSRSDREGAAERPLSVREARTSLPRGERREATMLSVVFLLPRLRGRGSAERQRGCRFLSPACGGDVAERQRGCRFLSPACGGGGRRSDREGAASSPPLAGEMSRSDREGAARMCR
jgi:hypothetical protein